MEDKEFFNPQTGEKYQKKEKPFWKEWKFWLYSIIAVLLFIVSASSMTTACHAINAGVGQGDSSGFVQDLKAAKGTTDRGGYDKYSFDLDLVFEQDKAIAKLFEVDKVNWDLTFVEDLAEGAPAGRFGVASYYNSTYDNTWVARRNESKLYLILGTTYTHFWDSTSYTRTIYISFLQSTSTQASPLPMKTFICTTRWATFSYPVEGTSSTGLSFTTTDNYRPVIISYDKATNFVQWESTWTTTINFQDIVSYYMEQGYSEGYDAGESDGYAEGHADGYGEGYNAGHSDGYAEGYQDATDDYNTGIAFNSYGLYANAPLRLVSDEVIGGFSYMYLFDYATSTYEEHTVFALYIQNSQTGVYNGYILDRNNDPSSTMSETIGSFSNQSTLDVVITAEKDMYFTLYTGYITSFYNRGEADLKAFWFSGGSSGTALQNYSDGYDQGFADGDSAGYNRGYAVGSEVGYANGVNSADPESLTNTLVAVFQQPFDQIYRFFNFNVLGLNILGLVTGLITIFVVIKVVKKII